MRELAQKESSLPKWQIPLRKLAKTKMRSLITGSKAHISLKKSEGFYYNNPLWYRHTPPNLSAEMASSDI